MQPDANFHKYIKLMDYLEDLMLSGFSLPFTPWTVVNGDHLLTLLDQIRTHTPEELVHARAIMDRRDAIISEAQQKGTQTLNDAKNQAEAMLNHSALMKAVESEAAKIRHQMVSELEAQRKKALDECEQIRRQALEEARGIRAGADEYAEQVLASLDRDLTNFHKVVKNGQSHLKQSRAAHKNEPPPSQGPGSALPPDLSRPSEYDKQPVLPVQNRAVQSRMPQAKDGAKTAKRHPLLRRTLLTQS